MDVVKKIINVPVNNRDENRPLTPPKIIRITFQRVGPGPAVPGSTPPVRRPAAPGTGTKTGVKTAPKTGVKTAPTTKQ
jgi:hypothetical protein